GDFVSIEMPIAEIWPPEAAEQCRSELLGAVAIASERDLDQDVDFGLRQLADTALKAMSPGINDPATAVTCIGYLRSILARLADRAPLPAVRTMPDHELTIVVRRRTFDEHLETLLQVSRYVEGDAWVIEELLEALLALSATAAGCGAADRERAVREVAAAVGEQAREKVTSKRDLEAVNRLLAQFGNRGAPN
nr:DUF2254 domain-containing protein [Thermoleophilaceae bacterium]